MFLFNEIKAALGWRLWKNRIELHTKDITFGGKWLILVTFCWRCECNVEFSSSRRILSTLGSLKLIEWSRRRQILYYPLCRQKVFPNYLRDSAGILSGTPAAHLIFTPRQISYPLTTLEWLRSLYFRPQSFREFFCPSDARKNNGLNIFAQSFYIKCLFSQLCRWMGVSVGASVFLPFYSL